MKRSVLKALHRALGVAATLAALAPLAQPVAAQNRPDYEWGTVSTVCDDRLPGSANIPYSGRYLLPSDQFDRPCRLRILWRLRAAARTGTYSNDMIREAVLERRGSLVTIGNQTLAGVGTSGDQFTLVGEIFLRDLPGSTDGRWDLGLMIQRPNGSQVTSSPTLLQFVRGGQTDRTPPRIQAVQIVPSSSTVTQPTVTLQLQVSGAQPTEIQLSETSPTLLADAWTTYKPTFGGNLRYTLRDRTSGQKTLYATVRAGSLVSQTASVSFRYLELADQTVPAAEVLAFAQEHGFRHSTELLEKGLCHIGIGEEKDYLPPGFLFGTTAECRFTLFANRRLNPDWSVVAMTPVKVSAARFRVQRQARGNDPLLQFELESGGTPSRLFHDAWGLCNLQIVLRGPKGADWRDAFRQSSSPPFQRRRF